MDLPIATVSIGKMSSLSLATVKKELGFGDDEINHILNLYQALANEIQQLKTLMQG